MIEHTPPLPANLVLPRDLPRLKDRALCEYVDGQLIERQRWWRSAETVGNLFCLLAAFADSGGLGAVVPGLWFSCFPDRPDDVRRPDVCFIRKDRLESVPNDGFVPIRPDLVADVYHPGDGPYDVDRKVADFLSAGVALAWVIDPVVRTVRVFGSDRPRRTLTEVDTLDGGDVLPGFAVAVRDLFRQ